MFLNIEFVHWLVILSALISLGGSAVYIRDTLTGKTKPNRVSWFLWAAAPLLGVGAALSIQADPWAVARVFLAGFVPLMIFTASFLNKNSYWKLTRFDIACGVIAIFALILWGFADSPRLAILFLALADGFAALPTLIKAWRFPETETGITYLMSFISVLLIIPSIPAWNIENSAFPIYLLVVNGALALFVFRKRLFLPAPSGV